MRVKFQALSKPSLVGLHRRQIQWDASSVFRLSWVHNHGDIRDIFVSCVPIDQADIEEDFVLLDPHFAKSLDIVQNQSVSVTLVHDRITNARQVYVVPASEDDWEVIKLNAGYVEENLLSQVAIIAAGQSIIMPVRQSRIHLIAERLVPDFRCVRLVNDTELIIKPLQRKKQLISTQKNSLNLRVLKKTLPSYDFAFLHLNDAKQLDLIEGSLVNIEGYILRAKICFVGDYGTVIIPALSGMDSGDIKTVTKVPDDLNIKPGTITVNFEPSMPIDLEDFRPYFTPGMILHQNQISKVGQKFVKLTFAPLEPFKSCILPSDWANSVSIQLEESKETLKERALPLYGLEKILMQINSLLESSLLSMLLTGKTGSGKTSFLQKLVEQIEADVQNPLVPFLVTCSEKTPKNIFEELKQCIDRALILSPCLLILDDLDEWLLNTEECQPVAIWFCEQIKMLQANGVDVLAIAKSKDSVHPALSSSGLFQHICVPKFDIETRAQIIGSKSFVRPPEDILLKSEVLPASSLHSISRSAHHMMIATKKHQSSHFASLFSSDDSNMLNMSDIGGLHDVKETIKQRIGLAMKHKLLSKSIGIRLRCGILLYGPPGCGKTLIASSIAKECGVEFVSVKGPEILNKYIGQSEKNVRDVFEKAEAKRPCVLFFDEFDAVVPKRGNDHTGVTDRVVNQFLTQLDGAEELEGVFVVAATSRPDLIDPALLRPGRLDKSLFCNLPTKKERKEILQVLSRSMSFENDICWDEFAAKTENWTGADLKALLTNAQLASFHNTTLVTKESIASMTMENMSSMLNGRKSENVTMAKTVKASFQSQLHKISETKKKAEKSKKFIEKVEILIGRQHLEEAVKTTRPSLPEKERLKLERIYRIYQGLDLNDIVPGSKRFSSANGPQSPSSTPQSGFSFGKFVRRTLLLATVSSAGGVAALNEFPDLQKHHATLGDVARLTAPYYKSAKKEVYAWVGNVERQLTPYAPTTGASTNETKKSAEDKKPLESILIHETEKNQIDTASTPKNVDEKVASNTPVVKDEVKIKSAEKNQAANNDDKKVEKKTVHKVNVLVPPAVNLASPEDLHEFFKATIDRFKDVSKKIVHDSAYLQQLEVLIKHAEEHVLAFKEFVSGHVVTQEEADIRTALILEKVMASMENLVDLEVKQAVAAKDQESAAKLLEQEQKFKEVFAAKLKEQVDQVDSRWRRHVQAAVDEERQGRLARLNQLALHVKTLENTTDLYRQVAFQSRHVFRLMSALDALDVVSTSGRTAFTSQLNRLKIAASNDKFLSSVIESIPAQVAEKGIPSISDLTHYFDKVASDIHHVSLVPDDASFEAYLLAHFLSYFLFRHVGLVPGSTTQASLARAEYYLREEQNVDLAVREVNALKGWSRLVAEDWLQQARSYLEVKQAVDVVRARLNAITLRLA